MFDDYFQAATNVDHQVHEAPTSNLQLFLKVLMMTIMILKLHTWTMICFFAPLSMIVVPSNVHSVNQPQEHFWKCWLKYQNRLSIWTWNVKWSRSLFGIPYLRMKLTFTKAWSLIILKSGLFGWMTFNDNLLVIKNLSWRLGLSSYQQSGWIFEDLVNYHFKELRCSTQCHTQMALWIITRDVNVSYSVWVLST